MAANHAGTGSGLADPNLLDKIDKLFACNVGEYIDLPQLVVVGDQSSGKSSVLEGLTALPFPRDSGLCTRFATQITFRRSEEKRITVSIIPARDAGADHAEAARNWVKKNLEILDSSTFIQIISEAQVVMGFSGPNPVSFSGDVLRLEICGPSEEHLSVIDVPGIFKKTTQGVTTKADMQMVRNMVHGYMKNPRSVMLAVVPANVDIATQEILEMAEEVDPDGHRTLGVLTKPDLVDKGAETSVTELIEGKRHQLTLGWNVVKNPGQSVTPSSAKERLAMEDAFFTAEIPWNRLDKDRVGVSALRIRLQEILAKHIRREFPKVKAEISRKLLACKESLKGLGAERETPAEQTKYLLAMAMEFQRIASLALDAKYGGDAVFDQRPCLKLATMVVNRNETFSKAIEANGHTFRFSTAGRSDDVGAASENSAEVPEEASEDENEPAICPDDARKVRMTENHPDLEAILYQHVSLDEPVESHILGWLKEVYVNSRGFGLGTFDPSLLAITMREQSVKWNSLAFGYISDIVVMVHNFICESLEIVCPDERVRAGLSSRLADCLLEKYKRANSNVEFILDVERSGTPATLNHYFNDNLEKCRQQRMRAALASKSINDLTHGSVVRLNDITQNHPMNNGDHVVREIHDILKSYYKVARKRFVDNICMQTADYHLVSGPDTPLKLFSPTFIVAMAPEQIEDIAGEDAILKRKRLALKKEIQELEAGRKILI